MYYCVMNPSHTDKLQNLQLKHTFLKKWNMYYCVINPSRTNKLQIFNQNMHV